MAIDAIEAFEIGLGSAIGIVAGQAVVSAAKSLKSLKGVRKGKRWGLRNPAPAPGFDLVVSHAPGLRHQALDLAGAAQKLGLVPALYPTPLRRLELTFAPTVDQDHVVQLQRLVTAQPNPGVRYGSVITQIDYECDELTAVGMCSVPRDKPLYHVFETNPPVLDTMSGRIHGLVRVRTDYIMGITDFEDDIDPRRFANRESPSIPVGRLISITLANGRTIPYRAARLWTDGSATRLFIRPMDRNPSYGGLRQIHNRTTFRKMKNQQSPSAFYFFSSTCVDCQKFKPRVELIARKYARAYAVDVDVHPEFREEGVQRTPQVLVYRGGRRMVTPPEIRPTRRP